MGVLPLKSGSYNAEQGRGGMPMDDILQVNERLRGLIWGAPMLILLLGTGLYFTAVTGVFQVRYCMLWLRKTLFSCFTGAARRTSGGVSPFAAMCTALAATVGTGNIAGVATALTLGGPGAVFWLWVSAFVGMMTAFAENTLGMLYREKGSDGSWRGGAMLYLKNGLRSPLLAGAFALFCVLASFGIGNMSQCNSIAQGLYSSFGISSGIVGTVTAVLLGAVLLGGLKRLSRDGNARTVHGAVLHGRCGRCAVGASGGAAAGVRADLLDGIRYAGGHGRRARLRHDAGHPRGRVARRIFK